MVASELGKYSEKVNERAQMVTEKEKAASGEVTINAHYHTHCFLGNQTERVGKRQKETIIEKLRETEGEKRMNASDTGR